MGTFFLKMVDVIEQENGTKTPVFVCDPNKNTACEKSNCGICTNTTQREFAKRFDKKEGNFICREDKIK